MIKIFPNIAIRDTGRVSKPPTRHRQTYKM